MVSLLELIIIFLILIFPVTYLDIYINEGDYKGYGIMIFIWVVIAFIVIGELYRYFVLF